VTAVCKTNETDTKVQHAGTDYLEVCTRIYCLQVSVLSAREYKRKVTLVRFEVLAVVIVNNSVSWCSTFCLGTFLDIVNNSVSWCSTFCLGTFLDIVNNTVFPGVALSTLEHF
jgi:hypothetical protein